MTPVQGLHARSPFSTDSPIMLNHHQGWGETGRTLFHDDATAAAGNLTLEKGNHNLGPTSRRETNSPRHLLTICRPPEAERITDGYRHLLFHLLNHLSTVEKGRLRVGKRTRGERDGEKR
jgi:hypothetical protein